MAWLLYILFAVYLVDKHMRNLRTMYSKVLRTYLADGREALSPRQKEIRELCHFLKNFMRIKEVICNVDPIIITNEEDDENNVSCVFINFSYHI